jgi:hypothetical protein
MSDGGLNVGDAVRYKPGIRTYDYEDAIEDDGRVPGVITGFTPTRVRVLLRLAKRGPRAEKRATVEATSLARA